MIDTCFKIFHEVVININSETCPQVRAGALTSPVPFMSAADGPGGSEGCRATSKATKSLYTLKKISVLLRILCINGKAYSSVSLNF